MWEFLNSEQKIFVCRCLCFFLKTAFSFQHTALHFASERGYAEVVKVLIQHKADVCAKGERDVSTVKKTVVFTALSNLFILHCP